MQIQFRLSNGTNSHVPQLATKVVQQMPKRQQSATAATVTKEMTRDEIIEALNQGKSKLTSFGRLMRLPGVAVEDVTRPDAKLPAMSDEEGGEA